MISKNWHKLCPIKKREFREALHITSKRATYAVQEKDIAFTVLYSLEPCPMKNAAVKCLRLFRMNWRVAVGGAKVERAVLFRPEIADMKGKCSVALFIRLSLDISQHHIFVHHYRNRHSTGPCWCARYYNFFLFLLLYHIRLSARVQHLLLSNWNSTYKSITAKCSPFTMFKNINVLLFKIILKVMETW